MKTLKEAAKIVLAGKGKGLHPRVSSTNQQSAIISCLCGRPQIEECDLLDTEDARRLRVNQETIERLERELEGLEQRRIELAKEIGSLMRRESRVRKELKLLVGRRDEMQKK